MITDTNARLRYGATYKNPATPEKTSLPKCQCGRILGVFSARSIPLSSAFETAVANDHSDTPVPLRPAILDQKNQRKGDFDPYRWNPDHRIPRMEKSSRAILQAIVTNDSTLEHWERETFCALLAGHLPTTDKRPQPLEPGPSLNVKAAARAVGISRSHLYEMLNRGEVQRTALGKIPASEIERLRRPVQVPGNQKT